MFQARDQFLAGRLETFGNPVRLQGVHRITEHRAGLIAQQDEITAGDREIGLLPFAGELSQECPVARRRCHIAGRGQPHLILESARAETFAPGVAETEKSDSPRHAGPTPEQLLALKAAIANAATLEEVTRLEQALTTGIVPRAMYQPMMLSR